MKKLEWNFNQITQFVTNKIAYENIVCEMAAIVSKGRWVNGYTDKFGMPINCSIFNVYYCFMI